MNIAMERAGVTDAQQNTMIALEQELGVQIVALEPKQRNAVLSSEKITLLQAVEKLLGVTLVAHEEGNGFRAVDLQNEHLMKVRQLEKEIGLVLVAYQAIRQAPSVNEFQLGKDCKEAELTADQAARVQQVEADSGLILMAYKRPAGES